MVYIIIKKSPREIRERMAEAPKTFVGKVDGYARGFEEADRFVASQGRDNPANRGVLTDDGGAAEKELRHRSLRAMGITNVEAYGDD